jgi:magnesium transporter
MISTFTLLNQRVVRGEALEAASKHQPEWIDLFDPTPAEIIQIETLIGITLPTRAEMKEIETSSRLYEDKGAYVMTMTYIAHALEENPESTQMTFILKKDTLITLRYAQSKLMNHFMARLENRPETNPKLACLLFVNILDAIVDYWADVLEYVSNGIDRMGGGVFGTENKKTDYKSLLTEMGKRGTLNSKMQESLVSLVRLQAYAIHALESCGAARETRLRFQNLSTDLQSLLDQASANTDKMTFLLDATLGLVSIEQNAIIKIFSVAAVIFLPPTLVASIYGMNFAHIPELQWVWGYPIALLFMMLSAVIPFWFFKHKGWL